MPIKTLDARDVRHLFNEPGKTPRDCPTPSPVRAACASATPVTIGAMNFEDGESAALARLNKTERRYYEILKARERRNEVVKVRVFPITLRLADNTRYTPDFSAVVKGRFVFFEIKGAFIREDGWLKLKMAAAEYPEFDFVMAQWAKGEWIETEVKK